jgi:hypothetical protein
MITSAEEFVRLRLSENPDEYNQAARDTAPIEVWLEVIEKYPEMRKWVAHNKTIPDSVIEILANSPDSGVRFFVAAKRKTPPVILEKLARDSDESVRHQVALNAKTPAYILTILLDDDWEAVVESAKRSLTRLSQKDEKP